jgi:acid phosphatase
MKRIPYRTIFSMVIILIWGAACTSGPGPLPTVAPQPTACTSPECLGTAAPLPATALPTAAQPPVEVSPAATGLPSAPPATAPSPATALPTQALPIPSPSACAGAACGSNPTQPGAKVPDFSHVIIILFENHEFGVVAGNTRQMPYFNQLAAENVLLTQFYAISHPSLPNYIALIGGDTLGITTDCQTCYVNGTNLPDLIEAAHRTWKTYQEDMPSACFVGSGDKYAQRHNPFIYFDDIRTNAARCQASVAPLTQLDTDLAGAGLPNYSFITPNLCNSAHDCGLDVSDGWLHGMITKLTSAKSFDDHSLIIVTFDEGQGNHSCCGLGTSAGGQVATLLISKLAKPGFQDATPYSHYSIIKTLAAAWGMPELGHAADPQTNLILAPWK